MSSIAYVTDEKMIEFHRLSRNRTIVFWRLSTKKKFSDFRKGDLLFFYARTALSKKKAFVGYAHFSSIKKLSINQLWNHFGEMSGYDSYEQLKDAIEKASKTHTVPKALSCLYLTDLVFFSQPIYPEDVGIDIPKNLESYCYIDKEDPSITVKILKKAEQDGVDVWSADPNMDINEIFKKDEIRHELAMIHHRLGKENGTLKEQQRSHKLAQNQINESGWEMVRGSRTDCLRVSSDRIFVATPLVYQNNDKELRIREYIGKIVLYKMYFKQYNHEEKLHFIIMSDGDMKEAKELVDQINAE